MTEPSETTTEDFERYVILSAPDQVSLIDSFTNAAVRTFTGPNRLERAVYFRERFTAQWEREEERLAADARCAMPAPLADEAAPDVDHTRKFAEKLAELGNPLLDSVAGVAPAEDDTAVTVAKMAEGVAVVGGKLAEAFAAVKIPTPNAGRFAPKPFLTANIPDAARHERLKSSLAAVIDAEAKLRDLLEQDAHELTRATALRTKLEVALAAIENGTSLTEAAERPEVVPVSTPGEFKPGESIVWASWNGPRPARVIRRALDAYYVEVQAHRDHPALGGFRGWIPAAELHHVGD